MFARRSGCVQTIAEKSDAVGRGVDLIRGPPCEFEQGEGGRRRAAGAQARDVTD